MKVANTLLRPPISPVVLIEIVLWLLCSWWYASTVINSVGWSTPNYGFYISKENPTLNPWEAWCTTRTKSPFISNKIECEQQQPTKWYERGGIFENVRVAQNDYNALNDLPLLIGSAGPSTLVGRIERAELDRRVIESTGYRKWCLLTIALIPLAAWFRYRMRTTDQVQIWGNSLVLFYVLCLLLNHVLITDMVASSAPSHHSAEAILKCRVAAERLTPCDRRIIFNDLHSYGPSQHHKELRTSCSIGNKECVRYDRYDWDKFHQREIN